MIEESIHWQLPVPTPYAMSLLVWVIIAIMSIRAAKKISFLPDPMQGFFEVVIETVTEIADTSIGKDAPKYYPLFIGIFIYVLFANLLGLIPGMMSPTASLNTTIALALIVFIYYNFQGIKTNGLSYLKHFLGPITKWYAFPLMILFIFIETIGQLARPVSLSIRLFGNIFAKEILLGILAILCLVFANPQSIFLMPAPLLLRPLIVVLGVLVSLIQAGVFTILSIIYVAGAVAHHDEGHGEHGEHAEQQPQAHT
ncbi:F0F1 ATP synthase subunit A [Elusimicrobiota bacterium]